MSEPSANLPAAQPLDNGEGLRSKSFIGLLLTQLLTAINDNVFRWLVIGVGKDFVDPEQVNSGSQRCGWRSRGGTVQSVDGSWSNALRSKQVWFWISPVL